MKLVLTKEDWSKIVDDIIERYNDCIYTGNIYHTELEIEIPFVINEDGYREEDTNGWIQTYLYVDIGTPFFEMENVEVEYDPNDIDKSINKVYKILKS